MSWESDLWNPVNTLFPELLPKRRRSAYDEASEKYASQLQHERLMHEHELRLMPRLFREVDGQAIFEGYITPDGKLFKE